MSGTRTEPMVSLVLAVGPGVRRLGAGRGNDERSAFRSIMERLIGLLRGSLPIHLSVSSDRLVAIYDAEEVDESVAVAIRALEFTLEVTRTREIAGHAAMTLGPVAFLEGIELEALVHGRGFERALLLDEIAGPGTMLVDAALASELSLTEVNSLYGAHHGMSGRDYLGPAIELASNSTDLLVTYRELMWHGQNSREGDPRSEPRRSRAAVVAVAGDEYLIKDAEGAVFRIGQDQMVQPERMDVGDEVFFVKVPEPGGTDTHATAVLAYGQRVRGKVAKVFEDRRYAFVDVADASGGIQQVFLHAGEGNQWPLEVGDVVEFKVAANKQGAVARSAEVVSQSDLGENAALRPFAERHFTTPADRIVIQNPGGGWEIHKPGSSRASAVVETLQEAEERAVGIVRRNGGGNVYVVDTTGAIRGHHVVG